MIIRRGCGLWVCSLNGPEPDQSLIARVCCLHHKDCEEFVEEEDAGADGGHEGLNQCLILSSADLFWCWLEDVTIFLMNGIQNSLV